jgi:ribonuclease G
MEAATEIGRQLRLRGIGGLIVIDFIHLNNAGNIAGVLDELTRSVAQDRTPTQILPMSAFGLVEMTRKRVREPVAKLFTEQCNPCDGHGRIRTVVTVASEVLRRVVREAKARPGMKLVVYAAPEIIQWIKGQGEDLQSSIRRFTGNTVEFEPRPAFSRTQFDIGAAQ